MSLDNTAGREHPETISEVSVTEVSVETHGVMPAQPARKPGGLLPRVALSVGVVALALTPVFGLGVLPAILGIILGHSAKRSDDAGRIRAMVALALSYVALVAGTVILVLVTLPIALAFLVSTGYLLAG